MAINVRVARIQFTAVNKYTGVPLSKDDPSQPMLALMQTRHEHRIIPDASLPHTADAPTLSTYLTRELPYSLVWLAQNLVITSDKESAVTAHVAYLQLFMVDPLGRVVDKNKPDTTIKQVLQTRTEPRVIIDPTIASTAGNPDLASYVKAEAALGFAVQHIDQTMIITYG